MSQQNAPLTDDERAELEALRAEKARREEEARAARERAELEELRREIAQEAPAAEPSLAAEAPAADATNSQAAPREEATPRKESFGVRMVSTTPSDDPDDVPGMAPAQKIIIAVCLVALVAVIAYMTLSGAA